MVAAMAAMAAVVAAVPQSIMAVMPAMGLAGLAPLPGLPFAPMMAIHPMLPWFGMVGPVLLPLVPAEYQPAVIAVAFQLDNGFALAVPMVMPVAAPMAIRMAFLGLSRRGGEKHRGGGQCGEYLRFHDVSLSFDQVIMKAICNLRPEPNLRCRFILGSSLPRLAGCGYCPNINH